MELGGVGWGGWVWVKRDSGHCSHWKVDLGLHLVPPHPLRATSEVHHGKGQVEAGVCCPSKQQRNCRGRGGEGRGGEGRGTPMYITQWLQ